MYSSNEHMKYVQEEHARHVILQEIAPFYLEWLKTK